MVFRGAFALIIATRCSVASTCRSYKNKKTSVLGLTFTDGLYGKGDTSTHAQGTDPRVALGAQGELP